MESESIQHLGALAIPGEKLKTPRPGMLYNVFQIRDGDTLVLQIKESLNNPPEGTASLTQLAELRVNRGALPRVLDVLTALADFLGRQPEMRTRLSTLEGAIPEDFMERYQG